MSTFLSAILAIIKAIDIPTLVTALRVGLEFIKHINRLENDKKARKVKARHFAEELKRAKTEGRTDALEKIFNSNVPTKLD